MHRRHRLRSSAEITRTTRAGARTTGRGLVVYHAPRDDGVARVALSVPRALGTAVVRNRTRRRLREAFAALLPQLVGCDIVVVARPHAVAATTAELTEALRSVLVEAGIVAD